MATDMEPPTPEPSPLTPPKPSLTIADIVKFLVYAKADANAKYKRQYNMQEKALYRGGVQAFELTLQFIADGQGITISFDPPKKPKQPKQSKSVADNADSIGDTKPSAPGRNTAGNPIRKERKNKSKKPKKKSIPLEDLLLRSRTPNPKHQNPKHRKPMKPNNPNASPRNKP